MVAERKYVDYHIPVYKRLILFRKAAVNMFYCYLCYVNDNTQITWELAKITMNYLKITFTAVWCIPVLFVGLFKYF